MKKHIKLYDEKMNIAIEWNGENTFNVYAGLYDYSLCIDCFTVYRDDKQTPHTNASARKAILNYFNELEMK